ncbi:hypothetical protein EYM_05500 [Ignicoccus islandicus DSM 13165]|uniref:Uncharacterized protein n=1 Tax=Ignicoccus islandicus DSM 13165 TaxID=940295 RepID=A0A0U3EB92_9CREN|nr:hypothetical protein [Ignicoccus islandicus]ALU12590.1 hypothetical protein EYM_05500 [Ignicoccus islandicus DSM 13165]
MEYPPAALARILRKKYYVARHADWLIVMDKDCKEYLATVYVYPRYREVVVVDRDSVYDDVVKALKELNLDFEVSRREPQIPSF